MQIIEHVTHPDLACFQRTTKMLINGNFRDSETSEWVDVTNPVSRQVPFSSLRRVNLALLRKEMHAGHARSGVQDASHHKSRV